MNQFEYDVFPVDTRPVGASSDIAKKLNRKAEEGWRFVGTVNDKIIMERPRGSRND